MIPTFETDRIILRPFDLQDAQRVEILAGDKDIAETTLHIRHPYPKGGAAQWIATHRHSATNGDGYVFAIVNKNQNELMGCISLNIDKSNDKGELGYWIGKPYWGNGYTTEAAKIIIRFGFEDLRLNRIWASAMTRNPASIKVMEKIGLKYEGTSPQAILKWGNFEDVSFYGLLKSDFLLR
ncbi:GNAT family N-acetyltransferase [Effusibacillus consociatus]|uniref:GNAT family N-acetyltransferase n=1 Tax=Effusibacillus consociatus TaxID=1117041 RepID=A0ABV9Q650_9BACL